VSSLDTSAPARSDHVTVGIAYMLGATLVFATSQAVTKWQVVSYSFDEVLFFRSVGSLFICALMVLPRRGLDVFATDRLGAHVARSAAQTVAQSCITIAFGLMSLGGAIAINFSAPLFATLAAAIWLKEKVGLVRGAALITGFLGVLLVASPGAGTFQIGALFALANAVLYGSVTAAVRGMSKTESADTLIMYQMVLLTLFFAAGLPVFGFVWPESGIDWTALTLNGMLNGVGQYWWTRALSLAPAAAVAPFYYFSLVWAMILGFVFWGDVPSLTLLAGSAVVVGSGLALYWHESGRKLRPAAD
jgi:drug/metabolite transporter (DMT)-like permease